MTKETSKKTVIEFIKNLLYEDFSKADIKMKVKEKFPKFKEFEHSFTIALTSL